MICAVFGSEAHAVSGCSTPGTPLASGESESAAEANASPIDPPRLAAYKRDVSLEATLTGSKNVDALGEWPVHVSLVNHGTIAHTVIAPGDGSDVGWREPHVFFTADVETKPGVWVAAKPRESIRCGVYDRSWDDDVSQLAPGSSLEMKDWVTSPSRDFELDDSANVRLYAHYEYAAKPSQHSLADSSSNDVPLPEELVATGPFALVAAPVELHVTVDRSLEIVLVPRRRQVNVGQHANFDDLVDAYVVSHASEPFDVGDELESSSFRYQVTSNGDDTTYDPLRAPRMIAPGAREKLIAGPEPHDLINHAEAGELTLRVYFEGSSFKDGRMESHAYKSNVVTFDVVP